MKERVITAIIALILFIPIVIYGKVPLMLTAYLLASVGLFELFRMRGLPFFTFHGLVGLLSLWIFIIPSEQAKLINNLPLSKFEFAVILILILLAYSVLTKNKFTFDDASFIVMSILYVGIGFYFLMETRSLGLVYIFYSLFIVFATDTGAYFSGRYFGKNKLWPAISPNKTIEGALGGILSALLVACLFFFFSELDIGFLKLILMTIVLSCFGQIGDLAESALKRQYDVKDSGKILPGHGGVLDRFDSLLFVLPILNLFL